VILARISQRAAGGATRYSSRIPNRRFSGLSGSAWRRADGPQRLTVGPEIRESRRGWSG